MPVPLADLPPDAVLRVVPCHPPMPAAAAEACAAAVGKLIAQWEREGSIGAGGCEPRRDGHFLLIAWSAAAEPLSGCRKDMLAKVLAEHGARAGSELLAPPPIVIERDGAPACIRQGELRSLVAVGAVDAATRAWDHLADRLGSWSGDAGRPVGEIPWLAQAVAAMA